MSDQRNQRRNIPPPIIHVPQEQQYRGRPTSERPTQAWQRPGRNYQEPIAEANTQLWQQPMPPAPVQPVNWGRRLLLWLAMAAFVLTLSLLFLGGAAYLYYDSDYVIPGVQVAGIEIGGRSREDAAALLHQYWQDRVIQLDTGETTIPVSAETLGMSLDVNATIALAHQQGRSWASFQEALRNGGRTLINPVWTLDPAVAQANLQRLAPQLEVAAVNATIRVTNGEVVVTPAQPGRTLDAAATAAALQQDAALVLSTGYLELVTAETQPTITDVSALAAQAEQRLATTYILTAYDPIEDEYVNWTIAPAVWGSWASAELTAGGTFNWTLDPALARNFLTAQMETLSPGHTIEMAPALETITNAILNQGATDQLRIYHEDRQHTVQSGETISSIGRDYGIPYPWIQAANPGIGDTLSVGQELTIPSPDVMLPLPVVENKRIIASISEQRVWVYENGNLKWEWAASTGIDSSPTAPGIFQVQSHEENAYAGNWDLWMPYFMGIYQPVPSNEFMNGFHGFPTRGGSQLLWTNSLGHKVTYGCILLSTENAQLLYDWAEEGVVVEVRP
jgi:lipoprotein-anchoring transpeptidase ErfK/SrfK